MKMSSVVVVAVLLSGCGASPVASALRVAAKPVATKVGQPAPHAKAIVMADAVETTNHRAAGTTTSATLELTAAGEGADTTRANAADALAAGSSRAALAFASAADGGRFSSPDGRAEVVIPPGVLDRDATVHVTPISTSGKDVTNAFVPGIAFRLDLGGAQLLPGKALTVTSPVDPRFVTAMQAKDPGFTPEAYGLRRDAAGGWLMSMPVKGPALMPVQAPEMPTGWALQEYGTLPVAATRSLLSTEDAFKSSAQDCGTFTNVLGFGIPADLSEVRARESEGQFVCDVVHKTDWFTNVVDDVTAPRATCQAGGEDSTPAAPSGDAMEVKAVVSIVGADVLHAKPGVGAKVHFELLNLAGNGPADVIADDGGRASTFSRAGVQLAATAFTADGRRSKRQLFRAVPGMGAIPLVIKLEDGGDVK